MEDKSISIIIPIYNAESTLKRCIDSIIKQSYMMVALMIVKPFAIIMKYEIIVYYY